MTNPYRVIRRVARILGYTLLAVVSVGVIGMGYYVAIGLYGFWGFVGLTGIILVITLVPYLVAVGISRLSDWWSRRESSWRG